MEIKYQNTISPPTTLHSTRLQHYKSLIIKFSVVWFYGISIFVDYLMPNPFHT